MNERRQKEKFDEIRVDGSCWVLNEEAEVFATLLQIKGVPYTKTAEKDYFTKFERGTLS